MLCGCAFARATLLLTWLKYTSYQLDCALAVPINIDIESRIQPMKAEIDIRSYITRSFFCDFVFLKRR